VWRIRTYLKQQVTSDAEASAWKAEVERRFGEAEPITRRGYTIYIDVPTDGPELTVSVDENGNAVFGSKKSEHISINVFGTECLAATEAEQVALSKAFADIASKLMSTAPVTGSS
jgi:hypothetical protein